MVDFFSFVDPRSYSDAIRPKRPGMFNLRARRLFKIASHINGRGSVMEQRLDFYKSSPEAIKAMIGLEQRIGKSSLEKGLVELVRLRASQINGCAFCMDMHTADARKGGEDDRRLATISAWRETPFFSDRERAALAWTESLTLISTDHVPDEVWEEVEPAFHVPRSSPTSPCWSLQSMAGTVSPSRSERPRLDPFARDVDESRAIPTWIYRASVLALLSGAWRLCTSPG